jgi:hypothetical protein
MPLTPADREEIRRAYDDLESTVGPQATVHQVVGHLLDARRKDLAMELIDAFLNDPTVLQGIVED